jgi:hypothetical protein
LNSLNDFLHGLGWTDVLQLDLIDTDAHLVVGRKGLHLFECIGLDLLSADRDDFVDGPITDDFPHDRLGNVSKYGTRLSHLEEELGRIGDAVPTHSTSAALRPPVTIWVSSTLRTPWGA